MTPTIDQAFRSGLTATLAHILADAPARDLEEREMVKAAFAFTLLLGVLE